LSEPVWLKEVECKACGRKFITPRLRLTSLRVKSGASDFHKVYEGLSPILYAVTSCPDCNYSARNEDFDKQELHYHPEVVKMAQAIKQSGKNHVFPEAKEISPEEAVKKHLLAISFYKHYKPENPNTISGLYMHVAWIYRENNNNEKEKEFMAHALEHYIKTFEKGHYIPEKLGEPGIMYLIGELNRLLGNNNEAVKWFSRALQSTHITNFPGIENMAREAWEKITEEKRKIKQDINTGGS